VVGGEFVAVASRAMGVGGREVGVMVGGGLVGVDTVRVDGTSVGNDIGVDASAQAVTKTTARMSMMI